MPRPLGGVVYSFPVVFFPILVFFRRLGYRHPNLWDPAFFFPARFQRILLSFAITRPSNPHPQADFVR